LLTELRQANLLTEHAPGRYAYHDLLRAYAAERSRGTDSESDRHTATHRMLDYYLHNAYAADRRLDSVRHPIELAPPLPGALVDTFDSYDQAAAWFTAERQVLLGVADAAAATGFDVHVWQLAWAFHDYLYRRGYWADRVAIGRTAIAAAHRLGDATAEARARRLLAAAFAELERFDDADTELRATLELDPDITDLVERGHTRHILAYVRQRQGRHAEALELALQAVDRYQAGGSEPGQANALNAVGWYHAHLGEYDKAVTYCRRGLELSQQLGDRPGQAAALDSLGYAHHHLGDYPEAIASYQQALVLHRELGTRYYVADTLNHLGDTHHATGDHTAARAAWQQSLEILTDLAHPDATQLNTKLTRGPNT
jgi:tetratricopeptide (TPR) repeat protein